MNDERLFAQLELAASERPLPADADAETTALRAGWTALAQALSVGQRSAAECESTQRAIVARLAVTTEAHANWTTTRRSLPPFDAASSSFAGSRRWLSLAGMLLAALGLVAVGTMKRRDADSSTTRVGGQLSGVNERDSTLGADLAWNDALDAQLDLDVTNLKREIVDVVTAWRFGDASSQHVGEHIEAFDEEFAVDTL